MVEFQLKLALAQKDSMTGWVEARQLLAQGGGMKAKTHNDGEWGWYTSRKECTSWYNASGVSLYQLVRWDFVSKKAMLFNGCY